MHKHTLHRKEFWPYKIHEFSYRIRTVTSAVELRKSTRRQASPEQRLSLTGKKSNGHFVTGDEPVR